MLGMILAACIIVLVVLLDQISKLLVLTYLYEGRVVLIKGILNFTYVENRGMAFGLLADKRWVFIVLSVVGIGLLCFYLFRYVRRPLSRVGLALIVGGGIGNMIDRVRLGFVVDFIDFCAFDFWVWVFNVADAAVCVGAALFVLDVLLDMLHEARLAKEKRAASSEKTEVEHE
ncbi:MAG: signal peptidase II [Clostridia bacterium]|nr:signal peptidase II [Clostridia bacterium]